ncbi:SusD/RagB family nutrient-binding outer membrane lipoprotein [uncultured Chitinophaga sp.]|uniref:SusD/RagB family nutrient-binding outer membrane lipoprotein n=1 Tax=uncultured Chitinophaga sp. TaxID=339340 RepID=UPI00262C04E8|nr:SusD/RagB family nutrient-binding outer membrane lipoprotein [uncultured Chitinophaga sp.]
MKKLIVYISCCSLLVFSAGCKKYLDVNTDPNTSATPPLNGLLASTTYNTGYNVYRTGDFTSYFVQYLASPNTASSTDTYDEVDYSSSWTNIYNTMADLHDLIQTADSVGAYEHAGAGRIMLALNLSITNAIWGSVPFREALSGEVIQPHFDPDEDVYRSSLALVEAGITSLNRTDGSILLDDTKDLLHHGNAEAWKKTAYALKARLLNRITKKADYDPAAVLAALDQAYTSNGDDLQLTQFQSRSPWNQAAVNNANLSLDGWLSTHFVSALNDSTFGVFDPRLPLIASLTKFGDYRGTINGKGRIGTGTDDEESYLSVETGFYSKGGAPLLILTYAECKFIEAEAAFRAGDKPAAYAAYLDGIRAHMDKLGVSTANRDAYVNNPVVSVGEANITLALIMKEKYVAMFLNPESWTDVRRMDYQYTDFNLPVNAVLPTFIRRVAYPSAEAARNSANVPAIGALSDRLWWDE